MPWIARVLAIWRSILIPDSATRWTQPVRTSAANGLPGRSQNYRRTSILKHGEAALSGSITCNFFEARRALPPDEPEFETVADAREKGKWFRRHYNAVRPHSSLDYATPKEFSSACDKRGTGKRVSI